MKINICLFCKKIYKKIYKTKYCSSKCYGLNHSGENNISKKNYIKKKISKAKIGKKLSIEHRKNLSVAHIGLPGYWTKKKRSKETKEKIKKNLIGRKLWGGKRGSMDWLKGNKHWNWKGGITPIKNIIRESEVYREWRTAVFMRDNYTCKECGVIGGELNADHIKRFADFPELRFNLNNGQTLCINCHLKKTSIEGKLFWINQFKNRRDLNV